MLFLVLLHIFFHTIRYEITQNRILISFREINMILHDILIFETKTTGKV